MPVPTLTRLTAEQLIKMEFGKLRKNSGPVDLLDDADYAVCLFRLAPGVEQSDYPALKAAIEGITGIQEASLLIDHHTRETPIENHTQVLHVLASVSLRDDTPEP